MRKLLFFLSSAVDFVLRLLGFTRPTLPLHEKPRLIYVPKPQPKVSDKVHAFDDLENWGHEWTHTPPLPKHEITEWQKRFDRAFGLNKRGESCVKLVWNGDRRYWWKFGYDWDSTGMAIKWEERPRILWKKIDIGNGDYVDLFPPRWLILARIEPEQYADTWAEQSYVFDPTRGPQIKGNKCANCRSVLDYSLISCEACGLDIGMATEWLPQGQMKQIRDAEPPKVFWNTYAVIGEHDGLCCEAFEGECYGAFRNPNSRDVDTLHMLRKEFEAKKQSPYEKLNAHTEAEIARFSREYYRKQYTEMPASAQIVIEHAGEYLKPLLDFTGTQMSDREAKEIVKGALDRHYTDKAENYEQMRGR